jgi:protein-S-isoprenylcysteine O-methyltransferase Ste14
VAVTVLFAAAMWGAARVTPSMALPRAARASAAIALAALGAGLSLAGVASFRRAKTTVNPTRPDAVSTLVTSGVYRATRNPMYLGFLLILLGWAAFLSNPLALIVAMAFVVYMNRFQIIPEERALAARFGSPFSVYRVKVRRWL